MSIEEELRRVLRDEQRALPGWADAPDRVRVGMVHRQRNRKRLVGLACALVVISLALPVALSRRPPDYAVPMAGRGEVAFDAWTSAGVDCAAGQLTVRGSVPGSGGSQTTLSLRNDSPASCALRGVPTLLYPQELKWVELAAQAMLPDDRQAVVLLKPGESAQLSYTDAGCARRDYAVAAELSLGFANGSRLATGTSTAPDCVLTVGGWRPDNGVRVSLRPLQTEVAPGAQLDYEVVLTTTGVRVAVDTCLVAREQLGPSGAVVDLGCRKRELSPEGLRFTLRARIPADAPPGRLTLGWGLVGPQNLAAEASTAVTVKDSRVD